MGALEKALKKPEQACPVCRKPMGTVILVCSECWVKAPVRDRQVFQRGYAIKNRGVIQNTGAKIIRELKNSSRRA